MRFGQGLIAALTNPAMGQNLFNVGRESGQTVAGVPAGIEKANMEKQELMKKVFQTGQEGVAAAQMGDTRALAAQMDKLNAALNATNSPEARKAIQDRLAALQGMMPAAQEQGALNKVKGILNIDSALQKEDIDPTAREALTARREQLLSDPDTQRAYQTAQAAQKEAQFKAMKQEADASIAVLNAEEKQNAAAAKEAFGYLVDGKVPRKALETRYGANVMARADEAMAEYEQEQAKLRELQALERDLTAEDLEGLLPEQQADILKTQKVRGNPAARALIGRYWNENTARAVDKRFEDAELARVSDIQTLTQQVLQNTDSEWALDENVGEFYRSLDDESDVTRSEFERRAIEVMTVEYNTAASNPNLSGRAVIEEATRKFNERMGQEFGIDTRRQIQRDVDAADMRKLVDLYLDENPDVPREVAEKRVRNDLDKAAASRAIAMGNIN